MRSKSYGETGVFAAEFVTSLRPNKNNATTVGLAGDLGSGKTTFVQAVARALGVKETVTSPTFVIMKHYKLRSTFYKLLIHIDAYRLENGEELRTLGWDELVGDAGNLILIEWPERVADALPANIKTTRFMFVDETTRDITFPDD